MSYKSIVLAALVAGSVCLPLCAQTTLKEAFHDSFRIGAAIHQAVFTGGDAGGATLVQAQFDTISPENDLKWERVHPTPQGFNFDPADRYVEFGEKNHMFIVGHCLVWHNQVRAGYLRTTRASPSLARSCCAECTTISPRLWAAIEGASEAGTWSTKR